MGKREVLIMKRRTAPLFIVLLLLTWGLGALSERDSTVSAQAPSAKGDERRVYLASALTSERVIALTANVAASGKGGVVLLDVPKSREYLNAFLKAYQPSEVILVGASPETTEKVRGSLEVKAVVTVNSVGSLPADLGKDLFPRADEVVVCAAQPRRLLLQAACLAGAARAPLLVLEEGPQQEAELRRRLSDWRTRKVHAVGDKASQFCRSLSDVDVQLLSNEATVVAAYLRLQQKHGPINTLVVANPADSGDERVGMSSLAPWVALQRRGALLLTSDKGDDTASLLAGALKNPQLSAAEYLILVGDLKAIPMERRPNPLPGKDEDIPLEPSGTLKTEPFTFATGRLFHDEPGMVTLMLARQRLLAAAKGPPRALIASNPGGGLPLLETISRNTANELRNAGYQTSAFFHNKVKKDELRRLLPEHDVFLWEGHHSTLVSDYGVPQWTEPLQPSLVFLQSCLTLTEAEALPFLRRGAVAVIGAPTRTYSASGGAFTLAYFDALAYEQQSLGGALRQAKNFLLAYAELKDKRLGTAAKLGGASIRSAWAFTLWGDPTLKLPAAKPPQNALASVRPVVRNDRITFQLPPSAYEEVRTDKFTAQLWPNGRLAGYVTKSAEEERKRLLPLLFAEVTLPKAQGKKAPRLSSRLPDNSWIFLWDQRRGTGYLLVLPRKSDRKQVHFDVEW